jgi:regulator of protease activity HflC (stomatin/prohibitin superfamily)
MPQGCLLSLLLDTHSIAFSNHFPKDQKNDLTDLLNDELKDFFNKKKNEKVITVNKKKSKPNFSFSPKMPPFSPVKAVIFSFLGIIAFLFVLDGFVNVPPGNVGVISDKGRGVLEEELGVGLHLKIPFWQTAILLDTRLQVYTMSIAMREGQVTGDDSIEVLTKDGQKVNVDLTVQYVVDAKQADRIYDEIGNLYQVEQKVIRPPVRNIVREVITGYESKQLFDNASRQKASQEIEELIRKKYAQDYVILRSSLLRNVRFSDVYLNAIEEKQVAEQKIQKAEFEKQEAKIRKERTIIEAEAEAEAISLKGESLRENPEVIQLQFVEKMAPQINWGILPDGALPLIDLKNLQQP